MTKRLVLEPMPGKIAVRVDKNEMETDAGLILLRDPHNSRIGEVVAIYEPFQLHLDKPDEDLTEAYVKVGDMVVFGKHNGVEVQLNVGGIRSSCIILKESEILTKVKVVDATND